MLFFITGASGAGKSACLEGLKAVHPDIAWYEFDSVGVPAPCPPAWRAKTTEHWIRVAIANQQPGQGRLDTGIVGGAIPGEVLACPSAPEVLGGVRFLLLDCHDVTRIDRLRARGMGGDTQDMLSWAAWQRVHTVDPQWRPDVIRSAKAWDGMRWERWADWQRGDQRWTVAIIDNTHLSVPETVAAVSSWLTQHRGPGRPPAPGPSSRTPAAGGTLTFDVASCLAAFGAGRLEDWIHGYLAGGPWANPGLSTGLRLQERCWTGPILIRLDALQRCCGPEPEMEFRVEAERWRRKVSGMASQLTDPMQLPPFIVEWRSGHLSVRDGNHRHAAAGLAGWTACWAVVWHNDPAEGGAVRQAIAEARP